MPIIRSEIGEGTIIHQEDLVNIYDSTIGKNCNIGAFAEIGGAIIGNNCRIGAQVFICPKVVVGDNVFVGPGVRFSNDKYPPTLKEKWKPIPTQVANGVSIGMGAIILPGCHIGEKAIIGAGAIVTRTVQPGAIVRGNPARMVNT